MSIYEYGLVPKMSVSHCALSSSVVVAVEIFLTNELYLGYPKPDQFCKFWCSCISYICFMNFFGFRHVYSKSHNFTPCKSKRS